MIQANELRIGNLVFLKSLNKNYTIECGFDIEKIEDGEDALPIPLTEEWLTKFRFYKIVGWDDFTFYRKNGIDVDLNDDGYYFANRKIENVHTLQNIYFAITGEELTITH